MDKTTALFTGQASQYPGMGKKWIMGNEIIRRRFEQASDLLKFDLVDVCINGNNDELSKTELTQPAIYVLSYSMYELFKNTYDHKVTYLAGHSLGEITALAASCVFSFEDGLKFVHARGKCMSRCCEKVPTAMYAISNMDSRLLDVILKEYGAKEKGIYIANYNTPRQTVLSGDKEALKQFAKQLNETVEYMALKVEGGFHSVYMKDAAAELIDVLSDIKLNKITLPVMNANMAKFYEESDDIKQLLLNQIINPVNWCRTLDVLEKKGTKLWIEFGPKNILKNMVLKSVFNPQIFHFDTDNHADMVAEMNIIKQRNQDRPNLIGLCLGVAVSTKNHNFDETNYQKNVVDRYYKIQSLYDTVKDGKRKPTIKEEETALDLLILILKTKGVSEEEKNVRIRSILELSEKSEKDLNILLAYQEEM